MADIIETQFFMLTGALFQALVASLIKFAGLSARVALIGLILPDIAQKSHFWTNSYLDPFAVGMKFATQISPLLNL